MNNYFEMSEQKSKQLSAELEQKGYHVTLAPNEKALPFDLGHYRPDLIATKENGGIIIEIKSSSKRISIDKLQNLSSQISKHEGWRFVLVTLDDIEPSIFSYTPDSLPNNIELQERITKINQLIELGLLDVALLYLWSTIESCLRIIALNNNLPIERFITLRLIDHIYSNGEVSMDEYDYLNNLYKVRNKIAHGIISDIPSTILSQGIDILKKLINGLKN